MCWDNLHGTQFTEMAVVPGAGLSAEGTSEQPADVLHAWKHLAPKYISAFYCVCVGGYQTQMLQKLFNSTRNQE